MNRIQIGIIDDHTLFRAGITQIINESAKYNTAISVDTPSKLFTQLKSCNISLLLLDIKLKEGSGQEVLIQLKEQYPLIKIVILTMHNQESYIHSLIKLGADGYLLKDITPNELITTLDNVLSYGQYYNPETTNIIVRNIQTSERLKTIGVNFSSSELDILRFISEGLNTEEIAKKMHKGKRTIEGYRQAMLKETDCKNTAALISWGYENKLLG